MKCRIEFPRGMELREWNITVEYSIISAEIRSPDRSAAARCCAAGILLCETSSMCNTYVLVSHRILSKVVSEPSSRA